MEPSLSQSARRVQECLAALGFSFEVKELPGSTRTAAEAAASIGCSVAQIAKSLVFREGGSGEPILVVASGENRVDLEKIRQATGLALEKADGRFVKDTVGFAIGGIPPVGHSRRLRTLLDPDLLQYKVIWAAAGTPYAVFALHPRDLPAMTGGEWVGMAQER